MSGRFMAGVLAAGLASASGLATVSTGDLGFSIDTAVFGLGAGDTLVLELYEIIDIQQLAAGGRATRSSRPTRSSWTVRATPQPSSSGYPRSNGSRGALL